MAKHPAVHEILPLQAVVLGTKKDIRIVAYNLSDNVKLAASKVNLLNILHPYAVCAY